jgi:hypothetical protein
MIGISIANSLGLNKLSGINPDAAAFIAAAGITGTTQVDAVNALVNGLQTDGLWAKMKAVYPFVTDNRNLLNYSENFGNAFWAKTNLSVTDNSTTAPNGTSTADTITANGVSGVHIILASSTLSSTTTHSFSVFFKKGTNDFIQVGGGGALFGTEVWANFNLNTGTIGNQGTLTTSQIESFGNGWYRCTIVGTTISAGTGTGMFVQLVTSGTSVRGESNSLSTSVFMWGAQLELGSTATTYQPIATTQQAYIAAQFKYNLVNPVDSDAAFRLVFNGGWTHSSNGATPNGTNGYADTKFVPNTNLTLNSASFSAYSRNNLTFAVDQSLGCSSSTINLPLFAQSFTTLKVVNSYMYSYNVPDIMTSSSGQNLAAMFITTRTAANNAKSFRNTTQLAAVTTQTQTTQPTNNFFFGAFNGGTAITNYSNFQYAFSHIGDGLTDTEASNLYTRVQAFQTALSRQV